MQNAKLLTAIVNLLFISSCTSINLIKPATVKTIQIEPLKSEIPETGVIISDSISNELTRQGFALVKDKADMKITGSATITKGHFESDCVGSVVVQGLNQSNEIILTGDFNQGWAVKTPAEIGTELGKNIAKKLK
jgi:hypothetical protein